jgi:hypothetical protein
MSIIKSLPDGSRFIPTVNTFVSTFNIPALGQYSFSNVPLNIGQTCLKMTPGRLYFIERLNFGATVAEGDFLQSLLVMPEIILRYRSTGERVFTQPYRTVNYIDNQELVTFFMRDSVDEILLMDFSGILMQVPAFIGINTITAHVSLNIYEIANQAYIKDFRTSNK